MGSPKIINNMSFSEMSKVNHWELCKDLFQKSKRSEMEI